MTADEFIAREEQATHRNCCGLREMRSLLQTVNGWLS